jgi:hypothetical protein
MDRRTFVAASVTSVGVMAAAVPGVTRAEAGGGVGIVGSYFGTVTAVNRPLG